MGPSPGHPGASMLRSGGGGLAYQPWFFKPLRPPSPLPPLHTLTLQEPSPMHGTVGVCRVRMHGLHRMRGWGRGELGDAGRRGGGKRLRISRPQRPCSAPGPCPCGPHLPSPGPVLPPACPAWGMATPLCGGEAGSASPFRSAPWVVRGLKGELTGSAPWRWKSHVSQSTN